MKTRQFNVRLDDSLWEWLSSYCDEKGISKTALVEELLLAHKEDRLRVAPRPTSSPDLTGERPDRPLLVGVSPSEDLILVAAFPRGVK